MRPLSLDIRSTPVDLRAQSSMHSPASQEILKGTTTTGTDGKEIFFCHLCSYVGKWNNDDFASLVVLAQTARSP